MNAAAVAETLPIPRFGLVVLMGPSGSGKTTFAQRWFPAASVVSSDHCRWMVANDERAEWASAEAFALLETWVTARLKLGQLTVVDSTALEPGFRLRMIDLAREFHAPAILIALEVPQRVCLERDAARERRVGGEVIGRQNHRFYKALARAREEGWNRILRLKHPEVDQAQVEIRPLRVDCQTPPPYDLIGDIHGCYDELVELIEKLGYKRDLEAGYRHPEGRRVVFVGDMVDRGPSSLKVLGLASSMERAGTALVSPGNHDDKLMRYLTGGRVRLDHGLERTVAEIEALEPEERARVVADLVNWLRNLPPYLMLDGGRLVVAHAGLPEHLQGRLSRAVAAWALYGDARGRGPVGTPKTDRVEWPITYSGKALVVYGHTPSAEARMRRNTLCIDQGCVFGGKLTAFRYPEGDIVQVQAREVYYPDDAPDLEAVETGEEGLAAVEPGPRLEVDGEGEAGEEAARPAWSEGAGEEPRGPDVHQAVASGPVQVPGDGQATASEVASGAGAVPSAPQEHRTAPATTPGAVPLEPLPDLVPLLTGDGLPTRWMGPQQVRAGALSAALEELSRHGVDPRWLVYIPPTLVPCGPSVRHNYLEHPDEVFKHYRGQPSPLVLEEMHVSTRGVVIVGRTDAICRERFGIEASGMIYTRSGRPFFAPEMQQEVLLAMREGLIRAGVFDRLGGELVIFEAGFLPLNLKNTEYLARKCLPAATGLLASRERAIAALATAMGRGVQVKALHETALKEREGGRMLQRAIEACVRPVGGIESIQVAPFQLLGNEHRTFLEQDRQWHLSEIDRWADGSSLFIRTRRMVVRTQDQERAATNLWEEISAAGGGGMVARALEWPPRGDGKLELPAMKIRGREFLRIIFGPHYLNQPHLSRLKDRVHRARRGISPREWALAADGLEAFARGGTFADYHPYALAVLANRSEGADLRGR